jgi:hypothetical protein
VTTVANFKRAITFLILISTIFFIGGSGSVAQPPIQPPGLDIAIQVQEAHTSALMKNPDVVGTAVGLDAEGEPVVQVFVESAEDVRGIPRNLEGFDVDVKVTGRIVPFKGPPGGTPPGQGGDGGGGSKVSHTAKQALPIQLGTSGSWRYDLANGYCCSGTLGSLVHIGNTQYILSNYHVLDGDIVSGGNNRVATNGDPVIQPGLVDVGCNAIKAQNVATLASANNPSLPNSNVDAAIAQVIPGEVSPDGAILEIGTISSQTVSASLNQAVKKSGRTTGLSRSVVSGLNATVRVSYENECAGGTAFTKTFTNQIIVENKGRKFLDSGDSGSLMVEDVDTNPRAVGLLYAGSSTLAVANPIDEVLSHFNATMVGN